MKKLLIGLVIVLLAVPVGVFARQTQLLQKNLFADSQLHAYWRFEGNSNTTVGSYNGTDSGMSYGNAYGIFGQGGDLTGTSYISISNTALASGNATYNLWFYYSGTNSANGNNILFDAKTTNGRILLGFSTVQYFQDGNANTGGGSAPSLNTWHMITGTASGTLLTQYLDGLVVATATTALGTPNGNFHVGTYYDQTGGYSIIGGIDDFSIFTRALTAAEISHLYTSRSLEGNAISR